MMNNPDESVIRHYKKRLISICQFAAPPQNCPKTNEVSESDRNRVYDFIAENNNKKIRRKRKNRNCRGQFRHEAMELIKLGTNTCATTQCKPKDLFTVRPPGDKPVVEPHRPPQMNNGGVIRINHHAVSKAPNFVHPLPQMVPQRRNSRESNHIERSDLEVAPWPNNVERRQQVEATRTAPETAIPRFPPVETLHRLPQPLPSRPPPPYTFPIRPPPPQFYPQPAPVPYPQPPRYSAPRDRKLPSTTIPYNRVKEKPLTAIDLTMEPLEKPAEVSHKCQCHCGKTYPPQEALKMPISAYFRGKMVNGVLRIDNYTDDAKNKAAVREESVVKTCPKNPAKAVVPRVPEVEEKMPPLFLIKDLLAKGVKVIGKRDQGAAPIVSRRPRSEEVAVTRSRGPYARKVAVQQRRQSAELDSISVSSSGSESLSSPKTRHQVPQGKLFYIRQNKCLIRYFDETQKQLFLNNLKGDRTDIEDSEIIELPADANFSCEDRLTVEEYVLEMTLVERFIPQDFFHFYKFVTGYQICNNNLPVSFLTFLNLYNTNGLKDLLDRYVKSLKA